MTNITREKLAKNLNIGITTLRRRMKEMNMQVPPRKLLYGSAVERFMEEYEKRYGGGG